MRFTFSKVELKELAISAIVIGFSFAWIQKGLIPNFFILFGIMMIAVGAGFVFHELAHKITAQRFGCFAEYRMWETGLIIAFLLAVSPLHMIFAAPGAVYIQCGYYSISRRENGMISASGPATNLALAVIFLFLSQYGGVVGILGHIGLLVNAFLALFNLLPFPPLDGSKIIGWNVGVWALMVVIGILLLGMN